MQQQFGDVRVELIGHVALVEICRPPHNFFDVELIESLAAAFQMLDQDKACRASVLASQGSAFCAGANFNQGPSVLDRKEGQQGSPLYAAGLKLFACKKPIVGAIHGAATGGGLGLAMVADFRVCCAETRFTANFTKLGIHPGFGLTYTLPRLIGQQRANLMFFTSRRIKGDQAFEWGLADVFTTAEKVQAEALALAAEIAEGAPLALLSTRATLRANLAEKVRAATEHEDREQLWLAQTDDFEEGLRSVKERRPGKFIGS